MVIDLLRNLPFNEMTTGGVVDQNSPCHKVENMPGSRAQEDRNVSCRPIFHPHVCGSIFTMEVSNTTSISLNVSFKMPPSHRVCLVPDETIRLRNSIIFHSEPQTSREDPQPRPRKVILPPNAQKHFGELGK